LRKTSYYTLMDIKDDLEQVFRQKVDLITLHKTMRALFRRKIEQDAIYL
jgi:predicted nucleotidyltransferase